MVVDGRVLLDGGAPLLPHMHRLGVDPGGIEAVFLTHFHGDHTLGLPPFVLHRVFVDRRPLTFIGPSGVEQHLEKLWEVSWGPDWNRVMRPQFKVKYVTARSSGTVAGVKYQTVKLDHGTMGSTGYRIHVNGKIVAYSGDTESTAPLDKLVKGAAKLKKRHPGTRFFFNHVYSGTVSGAVKDLQVIQV